MNLENYIKNNISYKKGDEFYNESFCSLVLDYLGSYEDFSEEDKEYLLKNGYEESDFLEDEYQ